MLGRAARRTTGTPGRALLAGARPDGVAVVHTAPPILPVPRAMVVTDRSGRRFGHQRPPRLGQVRHARREPTGIPVAVTVTQIPLPF